jgi:glycosyltransferase involved in cell wall biosynthesis
VNALPTVLTVHPSADVYGSDLQLLESLSGLTDAGWRVVLYLPGPGPLTAAVAESLPAAQVAIVGTPVLRKALLRPLPLVKLLLRAPVELGRAIRRLRQLRPDVVYVNTVTIPLWILAARICRIPVLVHVHEAEQDVPRAVRVALNAPLLLAGRVIANSKASAAVATGAVPRLTGRTEVIVNGVPDRGAAPVADAEPGRLALVARLSPRKGVDVALEAVALLRTEGREVRLDVCGTTFPGYEWYEQELRERARRPDLAGAVDFAGYVHPTWPVLAAASVVLVPSRVEPFGNTAVEALFAGRPLVASAVQGLAEIVVDGENGLLVPPDDPAALATAIGRLLDDPDLARRLADRGREDAVDRFSRATYQQRIAASVAELRRPGRSSKR